MSHKFTHEGFKQFKRDVGIPLDSQVFVISEQHYDYPDVRRELSDRGWVENVWDPGGPWFDLKWTGKVKDIDYDALAQPQLVNHYENITACANKCNLHNKLMEATDVNPNCWYPQTFNIARQDERDLFVTNYKLHRAESILKQWAAQVEGATSSRLPAGLQPSVHEESFPESVVRVALEVTKCRLGDIDALLTEEDNEAAVYSPSVSDDQWAVLESSEFRGRREEKSMKLQQELQRTTGIFFAKKNVRLDMKSAQLDSTVAPCNEELADEVRKVLDALRKSDPQFAMNGFRNLWILKPDNAARGESIFVSNNLKEIVARGQNSGRTWMCQKYIENPLLVEGRKQDLRQWVLVTSWNPLTIWFYDEAYIRIAAGQFSFQDVKNTLCHLTNNPIACHHPDFDPTDDYWRCQMDQAAFSKFLLEKFGSDVWTERVRPSMKQIVVSSLSCFQESISESVASCCSFELLGFDFAVDSDLNVWIMEINASPSLGHSTAITDRLVPQMVGDVFQIVLSSGAPSAQVGGFELLYTGTKVPACPSSPFDYQDLIVEGQRMTKQPMLTRPGHYGSIRTLSRLKSGPNLLSRQSEHGWLSPQKSKLGSRKSKTLAATGESMARSQSEHTVAKYEIRKTCLDLKSTRTVPKVAYLLDPKKVRGRPGYPRPGVRDRLEKEGNFELEVVTPGNIICGRLLSDHFDVVVVPGGMAARFKELLGPCGEAQLKEFLTSGGGYLGICAGAYLACEEFLGILPVGIIDQEHWKRGKTDACQLLFTELIQDAAQRSGMTRFPEGLSVHYRNGPLMNGLDDSVLPLLTFESELRGACESNSPSMGGSTAVMVGLFGKGRAVLVSPHLEDSPEHGALLRGLTCWVAGFGGEISKEPPPDAAALATSVAEVLGTMVNEHVQVEQHS